MSPTPTPTNHTIFDSWNSASTGHQRAENPYSGTTAWRDTRAAKLKIQFAPDSAPAPTGKISGGAGEWKWLPEAEARRLKLGCRDIRSMMGVTKPKPKPTKRRADTDDDDERDVSKRGKILCQTQTQSELETEAEAEASSKPTLKNEHEYEYPNGAGAGAKKAKAKKILTGTNIYINGSTMPHISDHRLKSLLVAHGAEVAVSLARRSVTHVIVGKPNTGPGPGVGVPAGAGGGLAAGKLQKEIERCGSRGVKVVGVEWALESIKAGKRLSEARFAMGLAPAGQKSVLGMFRRGGS